MVTSPPIERRSGRYLAIADYKGRLVLPGPLEEALVTTPYRRPASLDVVHRFVEASGNYPSLYSFLSSIFDGFSSVDSVSLYRSKGTALEHSLILVKSEAKVESFGSRTPVTGETNFLSQVYSTFRPVALDGPNGKLYVFANLDPKDTRFAVSDSETGADQFFILPLYSAKGQIKHGLLVVSGQNLSVRGSEYSGTMAIQELMDALIDVARLTSGIIRSCDPLTELPQTERFETAIAERIQVFRDSGRNCAVVRFDIDDFKRINDTFGHDAGDDVLRLFARILTTHLRTGISDATSLSDSVFRLGRGADEFVALLPDVDVKTAEAIVNRVRIAVNGSGRMTCTSAVSDLSTILPREGSDIDGLTKSTIFKFLPKWVLDRLRPWVRIHSLDELRGSRYVMAALDLAVYRGKDYGKNCVVSIVEKDGGLAIERFSQ